MIFPKKTSRLVIFCSVPLTTSNIRCHTGASWLTLSDTHGLDKRHAVISSL